MYSLEPLLKRVFHWYGPVVYRYRWYFFLLPVALTICLSFGLMRLQELKVDDPSYVFTPTDARWKSEIKTLTDLWPLQQDKFIIGKSFEMKRYVNVLATAKDGGDILRPEMLAAIEELNQYLMYNITVPTADGKYDLSYQDLCLSYEWECPGNEHIKMFADREKVGKYVDLSFPKGGKQDTPVYLGGSVGEVTLNKTDRTVLKANVTQMFYFLKQDPPEVLNYSTAFSYAVEHYLLHEYSSPLIHVSFVHYQSVEDGLEENANRFVPNFIASITILTVFSLACSFTVRRNYSIDWVRSQPLLAVVGLINCVLAIVSSFGFMLLLGVPYNVINTIIPFLALAVGVDDMFIIMACWNRTDRTETTGRRLGESLSHAAVAITITSLTDVLSFAVGCITNLPGIWLFCSYACLVIFLCYTYQLTFFAGFLAIVGDAERDNRHCVFFYKVKQDRIASEKNAMEPTAMHADKKHQMRTFNANEVKNGDAPSLPSRFFRNILGPILVKPLCKASICALFVLYIAGAVYGCTRFKEGLNPANLVTGDHYVADFFHVVSKFWDQGTQLHVAVVKPPNFTDPIARENMMAMVRAFENTEYTLGREGTVFFFIEYLKYLESLNAELENTERLWYGKLKSWLEFTGGSTQWANDIVWPANDTLQAFRFQVAMKNMREPNDHKLATKLLREIADKYPIYNLTIFNEMFPFADQYLIVLPSTLRNLFIALICMIVVSLMLIPSILCGFLILVAIVTINIGVFGYMTLWGVNLDAVSMISIIMSIGFAVDLSSHICYAYVCATGTPDERALEALETLGWPIFQGGFSTLLGISVLGTVDAYIILTFFKTIWLEMVFGMAHGLIFLPVALTFVVSSSNNSSVTITERAEKSEKLEKSEKPSVHIP
uniref:SSD domain-containing protein n=1 Tax=Plectus sambesii TaxID=2011161 RepID=A0A914XTT4_9BILA